MGEVSLVEMVVVRVSPYLREDRPLLWLGERDVAAPRLLPIAIGEFEAAAIQMPLEGEEPVRPISYDLLSAMLDRLGVGVQRVIIESVENSIFFARVVVGEGKALRSIDSRPSDAVALALRTGAPIFVRSRLLQEVGMGPLDGDEDMERKLDRFHELEPQITSRREARRNVADPSEATVADPAHRAGEDIISLQAELQRAVICEEFEEAARLRDKIESCRDSCSQ